MQQVLVAFFLFSSSLLFVNGSNFNEPHSHQGVVTPFERGDPKVKLDKKALTILTSGKPYQLCFPPTEKSNNILSTLVFPKI
eukprot:10152156-Ditylum_brightwellii.AAC.1